MGMTKTKRKINVSPFMSDLLTTTATSVITMSSIILVMRWLAQGLGAEQFGAYSLTRRLISTFAPVATVAMGIALPRYLGLHHDNRRVRYTYLQAASVIVAALILIIVLTCVPLTKIFTIGIFHDPGYRSLFLASLFMLFGVAFYTILYGYYRGTERITIANLWQLGVMAFGPLVVVGAMSRNSDAAGIVFALGSLFMAAIIPVSYLCLKGHPEIHLREIRGAARELVRYGGPRTPSGLAFAGMLMIAPFLAPYFGTLKDAGYLVVGQSMFRIVESLVVAFGIIALPRAARYVGSGRETDLSENIGDMVTFIVQIGLFAALQLCVWADLIVLVWLGPAYQEAIPLLRVMVLALPAYLGYVMLRSIIDAVEVKAVNTLNLVIGLVIASGVGIALASAGLGTLGLAIGTTVGFFTVGIVTTLYLWRRCQFTPGMMARTFVSNGVFCLIALAAHRWLVTGDNVKSLVYAAGIETSLLLGYLALLWSWGVSWVKQIHRRVRIG
jgi:O-antigen/teichoic acid export membrane protein